MTENLISVLSQKSQSPRFETGYLGDKTLDAMITMRQYYQKSKAAVSNPDSDDE